MRIAVVGSGGIGGYYGARLAKAGHDVAFVARGAHLEAMQRRGLTVRTPEGDSTIPVTSVADTKTLEPVDLVLFCVKSYDTETAARTLPPLMTRDTAVLTFQNGVDHPDVIASLVGPEAVLAGAVYIALQLVGPGEIVRTGGEGKIVFGELGGALTERRRRIAGACAEIAVVAEAARAPLPPEAMDSVIKQAGTLPPQWRSSMARDLEDGRRLEVEALSGAVVHRGRAHGIATPVHLTIAACLAVHQPPIAAT